jgi:hypothetical protein
VLGSIISGIFGGALNNTVDKLTSAYLKAKDSTVESEKTRAHVLETQLANALEAQRLTQQVRLATAGFAEMRVITAAIASPFVLHLWLVGLDTCFTFGWGIPAFPAPFAEWQGTILLSFFGVQVAGKGINAIAAAFIARR